MDLVVWMVIGVVAGALAGQLVRHSGNGVVGDIIIGVLGALLGGFSAAVAFGIPDAVNGFSLVTAFVAFVGALALFLLIRAAPKPKST